MWTNFDIKDNLSHTNKILLIGGINIKKIALLIACSLIVFSAIFLYFSVLKPDGVGNIEISGSNNGKYDGIMNNFDESKDDMVYTNTVEEQDPNSDSQNIDDEENIPEDIEIEKVDDGLSSNGRVLDPNKPMVALTFDDGPSPKYTEQILAILEEYNSVATFFEIGNLAEQYPEIIKKELEIGCELGNHSYSHPNLTNISEAEAIEEIRKTNNIFIDITGSPATLIRPPYGSIGDRASLFEQPIVTWSVDTLDWQSRDPDSVMQIIYEEDDLDGKVILMHSIYNSSLEAAERLIPYLVDNGYQLVTVSELYEYKHGEKMNSGELYGYDSFM